MYKPVLPRPKKTNIVRSRNGCKNCRERRTKCDEQKPTCGTCARLDKTCQSFPLNFRFRSVNEPIPKNSPVRSDTSIKRGNNEVKECAKHPQLGAPCIGSIGLINSLQHSERDIFYTTIWEDYCLPAMQPIFHFLSAQFGDNTMFRNATLALSSCNFSRFHPDKKVSTTSHMGLFSPSLIHQTRSQLYYSAAIRNFTYLSEEGCRENSTLVLTVLTVFAYVESSMGNFQGFYCHEKGILDLLLRLSVSSKDPIMEALLASWIQVRIVVWWARAYFCSLLVQQHLPSVLLPGIVEEGFTSPEGRRARVLSIMCESHRLNFKTLIGYWNIEESDILSDELIWQERETFQTVCQLLDEQTWKLDRWLEQLPPSELPIEDNSTLQGNCETDPSLMPIYFQSHEAALNFAYYVVARIMQCTELLRLLQEKDPSRIAHACHSEEEWTRLLLRIVHGTKIHTSLKMNNYTIGFSGLLLTALLRCQNLALGSQIQSWLQGLTYLKPTEEGAFPLYQTLGVVKAINKQKAMHWDVFGATQSVDDDGGTPKFSAYNSQPISTLLFHGICRVSGYLFTESMSIELFDN